MMNKTSYWFYILLASIVWAVDLGNVFFVRLFTFTDKYLRKYLRSLYCLSLKEFRLIKRKSPEKPAQIEVPKPKEPARGIVGGTKTVFLSELPVLNELKPIDTIELPYEEPEEPEELYEPDAGDFDFEMDDISEAEMRREMEASLYADEDYQEDNPDNDLGGVSVQDMEKAYNILHKDLPLETDNEKIVFEVLESLNGTDMFKMMIDTDESDKKAKSIIDSYCDRYNSNRPLGTAPKRFNIDNFIE